jgi:hypothetical protein
MRSRGIEESAARRLLLLAFANECLDRMKSAPVREYLHDLVQGWLPGVSSSNSRTDGEEAVEREEAGRRWEEVG